MGSPRALRIRNRLRILLVAIQSPEPDETNQNALRWQRTSTSNRAQNYPTARLRNQSIHSGSGKLHPLAPGLGTLVSRSVAVTRRGRCACNGALVKCLIETGGMLRGLPVASRR